MILIYVDESGDPGQLPSSPSRHFVLSGLALHERSWRPILEDFLTFRRYLRDQYGLKLREEIHASAFISKPGNLARLSKHKRLEILRKILDWISARDDVSILTVVVDKQNESENVFERAWLKLVQSFEQSLVRRDLLAPIRDDDRGLLLPDNTNGTQLLPLIHQLRYPSAVFAGMEDPGPSELVYLIEDPVMRDSAQSYFHQIVDVVAYFARQQFEINSYLRKKGGKNYYRKLEPVLYKDANLSDPLGIVYA